MKALQPGEVQRLAEQVFVLVVGKLCSDIPKRLALTFFFAVFNDTQGVFE
jgi:hypothetical protein